MQSMASLMSTSNNNDIAVVEDLDEDDEKESTNLFCFFLQKFCIIRIIYFCFLSL